MPTNPKQLVTDAKARMRHSVDAVLRELATMRTGRASVAMLDTIRIDYRGGRMNFEKSPAKAAA